MILSKSIDYIHGVLSGFITFCQFQQDEMQIAHFRNCHHIKKCFVNRFEFTELTVLLCYHQCTCVRIL